MVDGCELVVFIFLVRLVKTFTSTDCSCQFSKWFESNIIQKEMVER